MFGHMGCHTAICCQYEQCACWVEWMLMTSIIRMLLESGLTKSDLHWLGLAQEAHYCQVACWGLLESILNSRSVVWVTGLLVDGPIEDLGLVLPNKMVSEGTNWCQLASRAPVYSGLRTAHPLSRVFTSVMAWEPKGKHIYTPASAMT